MEPMLAFAMIVPWEILPAVTLLSLLVAFLLAKRSTSGTRTLIALAALWVISDTVVAHWLLSREGMTVTNDSGHPITNVVVRIARTEFDLGSLSGRSSLRRQYGVSKGTTVSVLFVDADGHPHELVGDVDDPLCENPEITIDSTYQAAFTNGLKGR